MAGQEQINEGTINREAMLEGAAAALRVDPIRLLLEGRETSTHSQITKTEDGKMTISTDIPHASSPTPRPTAHSIIDGGGKAHVSARF